MSFLFWNIKYVYLPTIFEAVSFSRVSKYRILSSSFRILKTTSFVERREWSSFLMLSYPGQYVKKSSLLLFRISQFAFASYVPPDAILSYLFHVLGFW